MKWKPTMNDPEIHDNVNLMSTEELLVALACYGVTREKLAYDCRWGYLPHPQADVHDSGRGRAGWYPAFTLPRAKYLYRLRKRGCEARTIRILLFLRDAWGWEWIREDCIQSAAIIMGQSLNGLKRFSTKDGLDDFAVDNIIAHQHDALLRKLDLPPADLKPTSQETTRFVLSTFGTGEPLKGATGKRLTAPIARAFFPGINPFQTWLYCKAFDVLAMMLDLRSTRMLERIANANDSFVKRSRWSYRFHLWLIRKTIRRLAKPSGTKGICFNLITLGGQIQNISADDFAKSGLSKYQVLAASVGIHIAMDAAFQELYDTWEPIMRTWIATIFRKRDDTRSSE